MKRIIDYRHMPLACLKAFAVLMIVIQIALILLTCCHSFFTADDYWHAVTAGGLQSSLGEAYSAWHTIGLYALFLTAFLNLRVYEENFYWFSGATSYTIPVILATAGLLLLLNGCGRKRMAHVVLSGILLFLACGGSLEVALPVCYVVFVFAVYQISFTVRNTIIAERGRKAWIVPFAAAYAGTLINGLAPGNYVRHSLTAESENVVKTLYHAVLNSLFQLFDESGKLVDSSVLCVMFLLAVAAGIIMSKRLRGAEEALVAGAHTAPITISGDIPGCYGIWRCWSAGKNVLASASVVHFYHIERGAYRWKAVGRYLDRPESGEVIVCSTAGEHCGCDDG